MAKKSKNLGNPLVAKKIAKSVVAKKVTDTAKKVGETVKNNPQPIKWTLIGLATWYFGGKIIQNARSNSATKNFTDETIITEIVKDPKTGEEVKVKTTIYPNKIASEFDSAMGGNWDGTNVQSLIELAEKSKGDRWKPIAKAYKSQTGNDLLVKLKSELNNLEYNAFTSVISNGSTYKYGSKEILHTRAVTGIKVMNAQTKKLEIQSFIFNGSVMGYVTQRYTGTSTGTKYYKMSRYPDYYFPESELVRDYDSLAQKIWLTTGI